MMATLGVPCVFCGDPVPREVLVWVTGDVPYPMHEQCRRQQQGAQQRLEECGFDEV